MNNKYALIGLLALVVAVSGCTSSENPDKGEQKVDIDQSGLQSNEEIRKFSFQDDGKTINCYVYDQHDGYAGMGGMSCIPETSTR